MIGGRNAEARHPAGGGVGGRDFLDQATEILRGKFIAAETLRHEGAVDADGLKLRDDCHGYVAQRLELFRARADFAFQRLKRCGGCGGA